MATIIGSARHDSRGKYIWDAVGDQLQKGTGNDFKGEVSMQYLGDFIGKRKWYVIRPKKAAHALALAEAMRTACNNINLGYGQECQRKTVDDINTKVKINVDCSKLIRDCIYAATNIDVGNFTTGNAADILEASKLFDKKIIYSNDVKLYQGDILLTQTKGHIGAVIDGLSRTGFTPSLSFKFDGTDFAKVFDPVFYAEKNSDVKKACGTNSTLLFNHFIKYGCNEKSRWGKTISTFNVEVYASHNPDLNEAFGKLNNDGTNGYVYYKHYCIYGWKETKRRCI